MCCRYYIDRADAELAEIIEPASKSALAEKFMVVLSKPMKTNGEIRPKREPFSAFSYHFIMAGQTV